jgi:hypothetical protein
MNCSPSWQRTGFYVREMAELSAKRAAWAHRYFQQEVLPMLTPLAVDASHPFPHLLNRSHNLAGAGKIAARWRTAARHRAGAEGGIASDRTAAWQERRTSRGSTFISPPSIKQHIGELFPGLIWMRFTRFGHAQQRPVYRRGRSGKLAAQHRAGAAAFKSRSRLSGSKWKRIAQRCFGIAAAVLRPDRG